jgi:phage/plasmid primase-like uncharacterized protein
MIPRSALPAISTILSRLDVPPGRRGRTLCPIHRGDNRFAFSYSDEKGQWFCHRCGIGGDAVSLVMKALEIDFKSALSWLGIEGGTIPAADPAALRRQRAQAGLREWAKTTAKELAYEHYVRCTVEAAAKRRLQRDAQDETAWTWLQWAYNKIESIAYQLDILSGKSDQERLDFYREWRRAA